MATAEAGSAKAVLTRPSSPRRTEIFRSVRLEQLTAVVSHIAAATAARSSKPRGRGPPRNRIERNATALLRFCAVRTRARVPEPQPTDPSISSWISRFSSMAYSIGSSLVTGSMKPLTIIDAASSSESPRLWR